VAPREASPRPAQGPRALGGRPGFRAARGPPRAVSCALRRTVSMHHMHDSGISEPFHIGHLGKRQRVVLVAEDDPRGQGRQAAGGTAMARPGEKQLPAGTPSAQELAPAFDPTTVPAGRWNLQGASVRREGRAIGGPQPSATPRPRGRRGRRRRGGCSGPSRQLVAAALLAPPWLRRQQSLLRRRGSPSRAGGVHWSRGTAANRLLALHLLLWCCHCLSLPACANWSGRQTAAGQSDSPPQRNGHLACVLACEWGDKCMRILACLGVARRDSMLLRLHCPSRAREGQTIGLDC
jgi:hypothetical protein